MKRELLKQIIADQREYTPPKTLIKRSQFADIQRVVDDPSIVILTGIRRAGKSTIQRHFQRDALPSAYYFNFDDERLINFTVKDFQTLLELLIELFGEQPAFYFDEIQNIDGWERFIRRLYDQGHKVFITGSNAKLLSKELGTHLTGRHVQFEVYPLSFREIIAHELPNLFDKPALSTSDTGLLRHHFANYLEHGGIPEYVTYRNPDYLKSLYEGILYRDIIARYGVSNERALQELTYYFASNIGKEFSLRKLGAAIGGLSTHTVSNYCNYLESCYLCFLINRYDHSLKKQMLHNKKCYLIDPALIRHIGFRISEDRGRLLENIVFLELKRRGHEIYFHKNLKECDFLVREQTRITQAIQVATHIDEKSTKKREIEGLCEAMKEHNLKDGLLLIEHGIEEELTVDGHQIAVQLIHNWLIQLDKSS